MTSGALPGVVPQIVEQRGVQLEPPPPHTAKRVRHDDADRRWRKHGGSRHRSSGCRRGLPNREQPHRGSRAANRAAEPGTTLRSRPNRQHKAVASRWRAHGVELKARDPVPPRRSPHETPPPARPAPPLRSSPDPPPQRPYPARSHIQSGKGKLFLKLVNIIGSVLWLYFPAVGRRLLHLLCPVLTFRDPGSAKRPMGRQHRRLSLVAMFFIRPPVQTVVCNVSIKL